MATTKSFMVARRATKATNYRFLSDAAIKSPHSLGNSVDFDECDVWGGSTQSYSSESAEFRTPPPARRYSGSTGDKPVVAASVPVNVPDWSKILREEYKDRWNAAAEFGGGGFNGGEYGGDDENEEEWVAPHEYLARTRNASFSVQEGIGRTLKGRDLSMVRNAIWEKTGFQD